jgi:polyisoprenoid-binding protein YceI
MSVGHTTVKETGNSIVLSTNLGTFSLQFWIILFLSLLTLAGCSSPSADNPPGDADKKISAALPFSENSTIFEIVPAESEARFLIDEILHGEEKKVIGKTNQISGQIAVDFDDPSTAAASPIRVNARTLATDNGFRNRAVQNRILLSGIYEFVTFKPTAVNGLPENITTGETVEFQMAGDLTITTYTQPVTFVVTAVPISDSRLEGSATTTINRSDFELVVPSATGVAAVGEAVILELDFVATTIE